MTILDSYINALLADAAYVDGLSEFLSRQELSARLDVRMGPALATFLGDNFSVVKQVSTGGLSSFDATLWKARLDGKLYLSMRGTQQIADFIQDADLALNGGPRAQLAEMVNWWMQLTTPTNELAPQIEWLPVPMGHKYFQSSSPIAGLGLVMAGSDLEVNGHSLGGHLAAAFGRLLHGRNPVSHVTTFNSAGFTLASELIFRSLEQALGLGRTTFRPGQDNYFSENGVNFTTNTLWFNQIGTRTGVFNEQSTGIPNHYMYKLTDALALAGVLERLDGTLGVPGFNRLLSQSSNNSASTLESALDAFRALLLGANQARTLVGDIDDSAPSRLQYQENLHGLGVAVTAIVQLGEYGIRLIADPSGIVFNASRADGDGMAYRYALRHLNPFVVIGGGDIYASHNSAGQLDLFRAGEQRQGALTDQWLLDRAEFLFWKGKKYESDLADEVSLQRNDFGSESFLFSDKAIVTLNGSTLSLSVLGGSVLQRTDPRRISFGDDSADELVGGRYADHLYGEGGDDALSGGEGDDYLEGGLGSDTYNYVSTDDLGGRDVILDIDGQGFIVFDGEVLSGGNKSLGTRYLSADGRISYVLVPGISGQSSLIINDSIEVRNFRNGDLGINLITGESPPDTGYAYHYLGDALPVDGPEDEPDFYQGSAFNDEFQAGRYVDGEFVPGFGEGIFSGKGGNDLFLGSHISGSDRANGGAGDDVLEGSALGLDLAPLSVPGNGDVLYGDAGRDIVRGGQFNDRLFGDWEIPSAHLIHGSQPRIQLGADRIEFDDNYGQYRVTRAEDGGFGPDVSLFPALLLALQDVLGIQSAAELGGAYDDQVDGFEGDDYIAGGPGSDFLDGGDGNDVIYGDFDAFFYEEIIGSTRAGAGFDSYAYLLGLPGDDVLDGGDGDDELIDRYGGNDALYGGRGNDTLIDRDIVLSDLLYQDGAAPLHVAFSNVLDGGEGDDTILSRTDTGFNQIWGGAGDDSIDFAGLKTVFSDEDGLSSPGAQTWIDGGEGNDVILVAAHRADVRGGPGNDSIEADTNFLFIDQSGNEAGDHDELSLPLWRFEDLVASRSENDLVLRRWNSDEQVVFSRWFDGEEFEMDALVLQDGTLLASDIRAMVEASAQATPGNDRLFSPPSQILRAGMGDDALFEDSGPALLDGGAGHDVIRLLRGIDGFVVGGAGDDLVTTGSIDTVIGFGRGDGADTVHLLGGTITLGKDLTIADLVITELDEGLMLDFGAGDSLTLLDIFNPVSEEDDAGLAPMRLQVFVNGQVHLYDLRDFASGQVSTGAVAFGGVLAFHYARDGSLDAVPDYVIQGIINGSDFGALAENIPGGEGLAPFNLGDIADRTANIGSLFRLTVPSDQFVDLDSDAALTFTLGRQDGSSLPGWLEFDQASLSIAGTPGSEDIGPVALQMSAIDADGLAVSDVFTITVQADAPEPEESAPPVPPSSVPGATGSPSSEPQGSDLLAGPEQAGGNIPASVSQAAQPIEPAEPGLAAASIQPAVLAAAADSPLIADTDSPQAAGLVPGIITNQAPVGAALALQVQQLPAQPPVTAQASAPGERDGKDASSLVAAMLEGAEDADDTAAENAVTTEPEHLLVPTQPGAAEPAHYGLTSWEITNALMQFHLDGTSALAAEDAMASGAALGMLSGMGFGSGLNSLGSSAFAYLTGQPQLFAGLKEGLSSLGEVRIA